MCALIDRSSSTRAPRGDDDEMLEAAGALLTIRLHDGRSFSGWVARWLHRSLTGADSLFPPLLSSSHQVRPARRPTFHV
jgi:hypothetical protein